MPQGPEGTCLCPTARVSLLGVQSSGGTSVCITPAGGCLWVAVFHGLHGLRGVVCPQPSGEGTHTELGLCLSLAILVPVELSWAVLLLVLQPALL